MTQQKPLNHKAIVGFTLGVLAVIIPGLGLFLGIIGFIYATGGIREIERTEERGMSLALAGKILSIVGAAIQGLVILLLVISCASYVGPPFIS
ncbi:MAG: DUF4190 domain-containing protein [Bacillota bacterium]